MKRWFSLLIAVSLILSLPTQALAWGPNGHKTVARIAESFLTDDNAHALARVRQILGTEGFSLASLWADIVKGKAVSLTATDPDPDTQAFLRNLKNKDNRTWHFVDLPLDCESYNACNVAPIKFTNPTDIVQTINLCITALRSTTANPRFSKKTALRLLIHLMGDLHQPLHVGSGFIDLAGPDDSTVFATDPRFIKQHALHSDEGANLLLIDPARTKKLHAFWDGDLITALMGGQNITEFVTSLKGGVPVDTSWNGQGQFKTWPAQWASESAKLSREKAYDIAHNGVRIIEAVDDHDPERTTYAVKLADGYEAGNKDVARVQLVKGGFRLAKLLEAIFP